MAIEEKTTTSTTPETTVTTGPSPGAILGWILAAAIVIGLIFFIATASNRPAQETANPPDIIQVPPQTTQPIPVPVPQPSESPGIETPQEQAPSEPVPEPSSP